MSIDAEGHRLLVFERRRVLVRDDGGRPALAMLPRAELSVSDLFHFALGLPEAPELRVADLPSGVELPVGTALREVRSLLPVLPADEVRLAMRALHVVEVGTYASLLWALRRCQRGVGRRAVAPLPALRSPPTRG